MAAHAGHSLHNNSAISVKLSKLIGRKEVTQDNRNASFETNHDFNDLKIKIGSTISAYDEKKTDFCNDKKSFLPHSLRSLTVAETRQKVQTLQ